MEESECMVCFYKYDENEYRPRVMPCGHTMCSKCLEKAIREDSKMCPKCRTHYSASDPKDLPVNFSLESLVKSMNISTCANKDVLPESVDQQIPVVQRLSEGDRLPECIEHQLPVSSRCSTHKSWICDSCLSDEHSPESCKIITITEELNMKKSRQFDQSHLLLLSFEETCNKSDDSKKRLKKLIEENDKEILEYESLVKMLQDTIQKRKSIKNQMENNYVTFEQKLETIKGKRITYDKAVSSLTSSETIRGVSSCSVEVQKEAKKLQLVSKEIENEVDQMVEVFNNISAEPRFETFMENHRVSFRDGMIHLHALNGNVSPKSGNVSPKLPSNIFKVGDAALMEDDILSFLEFAFPGQDTHRVYMRMLDNTARAEQHMLLVTGQCGHSYKGLHFYPPIKPGQPGELIFIKPYDGNLGVSLVKDLVASDVSEHEVQVGQMCGAYWNGNDDNALFGVYLSGAERTNTKVFGIVTSGLEILKEIAKSDERENIKVVDCGIAIRMVL